MADYLYNKAISFYNKGEYEKALDAICNSSMATSKDGQNLIRECEKLILEQHVYLIKDYIKQQDYLNASRKKEEYKAKYGPNLKIENIIIPSPSVVDRKECSEHQISNSQAQQSAKRNPPLHRKLFKMKRMRLVIIAIIALSLISLLGYRSYRSTGELQKKRLYEDSIRVADSIAAIEAAEEEYQRQMAIEKEQETALNISNSERQNPSPLIILPRQIHCKGNMAGFPITMDILLDETGNITGQYKNIRYGTEMEIKGKQENDGILNMTLNNRKETVLMKLSQTSGNTLEGYAEGENKQLKVHLNILSNKKSDNDITLKGMINGKYKIVMQIYTDVKNVSGSYYYVKNGSNNTLELSGSKNSNDYMVLKEYNSAGENTGTFEGKWSMNSYSGTFTNYKGIKMPFKLYRETTATNNSDITFNSYQNSRFNYTVTYPSFLDKRQESENGDGCKFYMDDNTYLVVSGAYNALDESIVSRYYKCKSKPVTYSMQKDNWFVISDYTSNGTIFYTKTVLQNGVFFTATFYYPAKDEDKYNPVIKKIFTNFPLISDISSISNSLSSFFRKNIGKYPSDINLLEFPLLKTRLIALVGNNNYNFIKTYFQVVTPIKLGFNKNPNLYEVSGGEEHNCMSNNITIVYNQQLDNLTVQLIKEGSDPLIFQEKKDDSPFE